MNTTLLNSGGSDGSSNVVVTGVRALGRGPDRRAQVGVENSTSDTRRVYLVTSGGTIHGPIAIPPGGGSHRTGIPEVSDDVSSKSDVTAVPALGIGLGRGTYQRPDLVERLGIYDNVTSGESGGSEPSQNPLDSQPDDTPSSSPTGTGDGSDQEGDGGGEASEPDQRTLAIAGVAGLAALAYLSGGSD